MLCHFFVFTHFSRLAKCVYTCEQYAVCAHGGKFLANAYFSFRVAFVCRSRTERDACFSRKKKEKQNIKLLHQISVARRPSTSVMNCKWYNFRNRTRPRAYLQLLPVGFGCNAGDCCCHLPLLSTYPYLHACVDGSHRLFCCCSAPHIRIFCSILFKSMK